jgi:hypothetical protein
VGRRPRPGNETAALARAAQAQLNRASLIGKSLDNRLKEKVRASTEFTLNEDDRRDFAAITNAIQHAGNSLLRALDGNKSHLSGLSEEQLEAQFQEELIRAAGTMTDEQVQRFLEARAKAQR